MPSRSLASGSTTTVDVHDLAAEFDEERPSRHLSPRLDRFVGLWCFAVSLFVLKQVFWPVELGSQYYLILFLATTLPLVFLTYRMRATRVRAVVGEAPDGQGPAARA